MRMPGSRTIKKILNKLNLKQEIPGLRIINKVLNDLNQHGIMLMYHRVTQLNIDPWELCVSPQHFEEHMKIIKKFGDPVQMQQMGRTVHSWHFGRKKIVLTFDDGYEDNFLNAKPIMERYGIPATFFIVTGMIDSHEEYWWDELDRIILTSPKLPDQFKMTINKNDYYWPLKPGIPAEILNYAKFAYSIPENGSEMVYGQLYYVLWNILSHLSFEEKKAVLQAIARWAGQTTAARTSHKVMSKKELLDLAGVSLFEIGAHTQHHPMLSYLTIEEQRQEIEESKNSLEKILGCPIQSFSYPHGAFTDETVELVRKLGFVASCRGAKKQISREHDPMLLPRFMVYDWDGNVFEQKLSEWLK